MLLRSLAAGLEAYDAVDAAFFFTVTDLTADLSNILSYSSASVLLRLLSGQLQQVSCLVRRLQTHHMVSPSLELVESSKG